MLIRMSSNKNEIPPLFVQMNRFYTENERSFWKEERRYFFVSLIKHFS
jgi:hypothetical protein